MLALSNPGPFQVSAAPMSDAQGGDVLVAVIRGTFDLQGRMLPKEEQTPIVEADEFWGEPGVSSLKAASDLSLGKKGTDILLAGHAYPDVSSGQRSTGELILRAGALEKKARVFGERVWQRTWTGARVSVAKPFEKIPLRWEFAYGGIVLAPTPDGKPRGEARNPVGMGFRVEFKKKPEEGHPLPHFEAEGFPIRSWKDECLPCGFGPIARHWQPRLGFAGTYDEDWQKTRAPVLPKDFDTRFFNVAPADQILAEPLVGGEPFEISGVAPGGPVRFSLPKWRQAVTCRFARRAEEKDARLETVSINTDTGRIAMVWQASITCDRETLQIKEISLASVPIQ